MKWRQTMPHMWRARRYFMGASEYFRVGVDRMGGKWLADTDGCVNGGTAALYRTLYGAKMAAERRVKK